VCGSLLSLLALLSAASGSRLPSALLRYLLPLVPVDAATIGDLLSSGRR